VCRPAVGNAGEFVTVPSPVGFLFGHVPPYSVYMGSHLRVMYVGHLEGHLATTSVHHNTLMLCFIDFIIMIHCTGAHIHTLVEVVFHGTYICSLLTSSLYRCCHGFN
jgi:hypothetical protein